MEAIPTTERLKITLDLIANIPNFDGNTSYFLDSLAPIFATFHPNVSVIITNYIRDKIVGRARLELQKHGRLDNWDEMKEVLKNRFGEKASVHSLVDQIRTARVDTTIEAFYNKISYLLSRANNSYLLNNNENNTELINSNKRIALEAFKNNLPEPTGTIVLSRNPETLNDAYKIISEINHHYTDYSNCRTQNVSNNFLGQAITKNPILIIETTTIEYNNKDKRHDFSTIVEVTTMFNRATTNRITITKHKIIDLQDQTTILFKAFRHTVVVTLLTAVNLDKESTTGKTITTNQWTLLLARTNIGTSLEDSKIFAETKETLTLYSHRKSY